MILPLVTIIIPVYNAEKYLEETILSVINQTWPNKQLIIVDDGSSDGSLSIAKRHRCDWITVISQKNKGASAARNKGITEAKGTYIQFLDADDLLSPDKIKEQVIVLQQSPDKLAICSTIHFFNNEWESSLPSPYEESFLFSDNDPVHFLINLWGGHSNNGSMITIHSWLTPRNLIEKAGLWNEELSLDDDGEFFCRVVLNSEGIVKTKNVFNYYRKHHNHQNLSSKKSFNNLSSLLRSVQSKKKELLLRTNTKEAQHSISLQLYNIFLLSYPMYPAIYKVAENELSENFYKYSPNIGGKTINLIANILGLKIALKMQYLLHLKIISKIVNFKLSKVLTIQNKTI